MDKKITISNRAMLLGVFICGLIVSALMSLFFLVSYEKFGLAPTAGVLFLTGGLFGSRMMFKFMSGAMGKIFKEIDFEDQMNIVMLDAYNEVLRHLNKYDKDTVISHVEKLRDNCQEKFEDILEVEGECPDCGGFH